MFTLKPGDFDSYVAVACVKSRKNVCRALKLVDLLRICLPSVLDSDIVLFSRHD